MIKFILNKSLPIGIIAFIISADVFATKTVELNFQNTRIDAVANALGALLEKNVIIDPSVKGDINLISEKPVTPNQALKQFQSIIRLHGYSLIETDNVLKLVPESEAKILSTKVNSSLSGYDVMTKVFSLKHESAVNVLNIVKPLVSNNNVISISPNSNSLIVTDYPENIRRIEQLITSVDRSNFHGLQVIKLEHAVASELAPLIQRLVDAGITGKDMSGVFSEIIPDNRSNSLLIRAANASKQSLIEALIWKLDKPLIQNELSIGNIHVVYLKHADALALAETLRAAIKTIEMSAPVPVSSNSQVSQSSTTPMPSPLPVGGIQNIQNNLQNSSRNSGIGLGEGLSINTGQVQMPNIGGTVQADPSTNSLLITAPLPLYRQLRTVIDKLDSRRAQVMIESMIVEVTEDKLAEFGVQWQTAFGNNSGTLGAVGTNSTIGSGNILQIAANIASGNTSNIASALSSLGGGINIAVAPKAFGQHYLGALANFLQRDGVANVMSKPNLMTLDNQEARITIGNNVPFVTGSYASTGGNGTVNPFTTVERKDVGLMLRVKPTINENGTVKLVVSQEASSVDLSTLNDPRGPTTSKRSVESTVLVEDGSIVMLGGLMEDQYSSKVEKIPLLSDLPIVGNAFKSENRTRRKTNMMIFLRPIIMRDAHSAESMSAGRYREIKGLQQSLNPKPSYIFKNIGGAPVSQEFDKENKKPDSLENRDDETININPIM